MSIDEIREFLDGLGRVLTLAPGPGDGSPEIAWGDLFFYYAPNGVVPSTQPFATIVTKDYPDDEGSRLVGADDFRVNVAAGAAEFRARTGHEPREPAVGDAGERDMLLAHPVYGGLGWLCVVNPGPRTDAPLRELLTTAHGLARARQERRAGPPA